MCCFLIERTRIEGWNVFVCELWWKQPGRLDRCFEVVVNYHQGVICINSLIFLFLFHSEMQFRKGRHFRVLFDCPLFEVSTCFLIVADLNFDDWQGCFGTNISTTATSTLPVKSRVSWMSHNSLANLCERGRVVSTGTTGWTGSFSIKYSFFFLGPWSLPCTRSIYFHLPLRDLCCFLVFILWSCIVGRSSFGLLLEIAVFLYLPAIWQSLNRIYKNKNNLHRI